jgi:hypothetical protein
MNGGAEHPDAEYRSGDQAGGKNPLPSSRAGHLLARAPSPVERRQSGFFTVSLPVPE